jgi:DNA-binding SARP family transcriptional activator
VSELRVHLFGKLCVERGDRALVGLDSRRVQELLVYLLLFRDHPHPRERLADVMWGEGTSVQVRRGLRQALWKLQSVLGSPGGNEGNGENGSGKPSLLCVDTDYVQLNAAADVWVDAVAFEGAYARVQGSPGAALDDGAAYALRVAADLYHGDLLDGWYQDWCLFERERYQHMYLEMLAKLMGYAEARGDYEAGVDYGTRILRHDRARERIHRGLMRLHYLAGDRTGALRQYDRCVAVLADEIGVGPAQRTVDLAEAMRGDAWVPAGLNGASRATAHLASSSMPAALGSRATNGVNGHAASAGQGCGMTGCGSSTAGVNGMPATAGVSVASSTATLNEVLGELKWLRTALGDIERRVDQEIVLIQQVLGE